MKVTLFESKDWKDLTPFPVFVSHISMSEKHEITLHFILKDEMIKLIKVLIAKYVLFKVQGKKITFIPEANNHQRVVFRFDS